MKLNGSARPVAIQVIVYSTLDVNDQRDLTAHEIELPAEIVFDISLNDRDGPSVCPLDLAESCNPEVELFPTLRNYQSPGRRDPLAWF